MPGQLLPRDQQKLNSQVFVNTELWARKLSLQAKLFRTLLLGYSVNSSLQLIHSQPSATNFWTPVKVGKQARREYCLPQP